MQSSGAYIVHAIRTPVGKAPKGCFANTRPDDLLSFLIQHMIKAYPQMDPKLIDDVIIGCAMQEGTQGMNIARLASQYAQLPHSVPGITVNRLCASSLESIAMAANRITLGYADIILAGGVESMSAVPMGGHQIRPNIQCFGKNKALSSLVDTMGLTAENIATRYGITREAQDAFALRSHQKAIQAQQNGAFDSEIIPYPLCKQATSPEEKASEINCLHDEGPRKDSTSEALAQLQPAFKSDGSVTAGNSSQISDGAGLLLLMSPRMVKRLKLKPLARFCGYQISGIDPAYMGMGPTFAVPKVLKQTGLTLDELDWIELNEAFAVQSLAVIKALDLNEQRVNPLGGAIALGHPLGASGALRTTTLLHGLKQRGNRYGMTTLCVGMGMGVAALFENMQD
jgi:acetyl-CoA acyltransferase